MDRQNWLDGLKPGDQVAVFGYGLPRIMTVTGRTDTHIRIGHDSYFAESGHATGQRHGSISQITTEIEDVIEWGFLRDVVAGHLWGEESLSTLRSVASIIGKKGA